jgi:hypothetical protein
VLSLKMQTHPIFWPCYQSILERNNCGSGSIYGSVQDYADGFTIRIILILP